MFLCRNALVLLAFLIVASICLFQFKSFCIVTPRYFAVLASSSVLLCILYENWTGSCLEVMWRTWHCWEWNSISQSFSHCWSLSKSSWMSQASDSVSIVLYKMQSSANNLAVDLGDMYSGRSFMNKRNSRCPRTLPWGTPDWTGADDEVTPSRRTCCDLFPRKLLIQLWRLPLIP